MGVGLQRRMERKSADVLNTESEAETNTNLFEDRSSNLSERAISLGNVRTYTAGSKRIRACFPSVSYFGFSVTGYATSLRPMMASPNRPAVIVRLPMVIEDRSDRTAAGAAAD